MTSSVKYPEFATWKKILFINFFFFTKDEKWKRENGIIPVTTEQTNDRPSINQLTVPKHVLLLIFYNHWLQCSMDNQFELLQEEN